MIAYSATALRHVDELAAYYRKQRRPEAIRNLLAVLRRVEAAIESGPARPRSYPATYRELARPDRAWIKDAPYWIAYYRGDPNVIATVFWEGADMVGCDVEQP